MQHALMFQTPALEEGFRRLTNSDHEVGGFLMCDYSMPHVGIHRDYEKIAKARYTFVRSWIVVPNQSDSPHNTWTTRDFALVNDIAAATAQSLSGWWTQAIHFHTHPTGPAIPSKNDVAFTLANLMPNGVFADAIIVSRAPMRVIGRTYQRNTRTGEVNFSTWAFASWRQRAFRNLWNKLTGPDHEEG